MARTRVIASSFLARERSKFDGTALFSTECWDSAPITMQAVTLQRKILLQAGSCGGFACLPWSNAILRRDPQIS